MPAQRIECPAPGCGWWCNTFIEPDEFPFYCPKCGCPIWDYAKAKGIRWKVYDFNDPAVFVVVEWPRYELESIREEAIKASDKFSRRDGNMLGVRRCEEVSVGEVR